MTRNLFSAFLLLLLAGACASGDEFLASDPPVDSMDWWKKKTGGHKDLRALCVSHDSSLALNVQWYLMVTDNWQTVPGYPQAKKFVPLDVRLTSQFLGFLEGRLRVNAPTWWKHDLIQGLAVGGKLSTLRDDARLHARNPSGDLVIVKRNEEVVALTGIAEQPLLLPVSILRPNDFPMGGSQLLYAYDDTRILVAQIDGESSNYDIALIDRKTGRLLWTSGVETGGGSAGVSGMSGGHSAEVELAEERAIVFGVSGHSVYLQAFAISNGRCEGWWNSELSSYLIDREDEESDRGQAGNND